MEPAEQQAAKTELCLLRGEIRELEWLIDNSPDLLLARIEWHRQLDARVRRVNELIRAYSLFIGEREPPWRRG